MNRIKNLFCVALILTACKTGSEFERQREQLPTEVQNQQTLPFKPTIIVSKFIFQGERFSQDTYKKGMWIPGYLGVDYEAFGPWPDAERQKGLTNIYDHPNFATELAAYAAEKSKATNSTQELKFSIEGSIISAITAVRYHTYGCWPVVGTFANIFNAESMTIINSTKIQYRITKPDGKIVERQSTIATPKIYRFWHAMSYKLGLDIGHMQTDAMEEHMTAIKQTLYTQILNSN